MAKKRRKSSPVRRRRVSGTGGYKDIAMVVVGAAVGGSLGRMLAVKLAPKVNNNNMVNGGQIAVGVYVASKAKSPFFKGIGIGCATIGVADILQRNKVISGVEDEQLYIMSGDDDEMMSGDDDMDSNVSGTGDDMNSSVAGDDEYSV